MKKSKAFHKDDRSAGVRKVSSQNVTTNEKLGRKNDKKRKELTKEENQPSKSVANELDDIFAVAKHQAKAPETKQEQRKKKQKKSEPGVEGNKDDIFGAGPSQARRRTKEGYAIYSEQELELNKGGMTDLCPFDCKCCY